MVDKKELLRHKDEHNCIYLAVEDTHLYLLPLIFHNTESHLTFKLYYSILIHC